MSEECRKPHKEPILILEEIKYRNASTDRCDIVHAPCACGSWHDEEWLMERWLETGLQSKLAISQLKTINEILKK